MKLLYGMHTYDYGHLNRSTPIVQALRDLGAEVDVCFSGKILSDDNEYAMHLEPKMQFEGLHDVVTNGKNQYLASFKDAQLITFVNDVRNLDLSSYDFIVNDFDHVSAWAAKLQKKHCIGINRACTFRYSIPCPPSNFIAKFLFSRIVPCDIAIGLHWHHFNQPILPPVGNVRYNLEKIVDGKFILVYLPGENIENQTKVLRQLDTKIKIYHPSIIQNTESGNIEYLASSKTGFRADLYSCSGVITNAGFNTTTEALLLGKRLLVIPKKKFIEQQANAYAIIQLGLGTVIKQMDVKEIKQWTEVTHSTKQLVYPDIAPQLASWLLETQAANLPEFSKSIWQDIDNGFDN